MSPQTTKGRGQGAEPTCTCVKKYKPIPCAGFFSSFFRRHTKVSSTGGLCFRDGFDVQKGNRPDCTYRGKMFVQIFAQTKTETLRAMSPVDKNPGTGTAGTSRMR